MLWVSKKAVLDGTKAIRGGIPVIFPQFGPLGSMKSHGFGRISVWDLEGISSSLLKKEISATFRLTENELSKKMWGESVKFIYDLKVTLKADAVTSAAGTKPDFLLELESTVTNTGDETFDLTCAMHSYFPISDITAASVSSIEPGTFKGCKYIDQLAEGKERADKIKTQESEKIIFDKETDSIYLNVPKHLQVIDSKTGLRIIQETNYKDAVIWNPWINKAKAMSDFGDEEYKEMVCVEVAEIGTKGNAIEVKAGEVSKRTFCITSN